MRFINRVLAFSMAAFIAGQVQAEVSPQEAAKLGSSLTFVGAEKAANSDGSIPAFTGGLTTAPAGFKPGDSFRPNPFAAERPILVINAKNADQYKSQLTAVTYELAKRFPGFRVDVYPTHRSANLPKKLLDNTVKNATGAKALDGGNSIENALPGVPFPIPQSGAEAMWNHLMRYQGVMAMSKYDAWSMSASGEPFLTSTGVGYNSYPIYEDMDKVIQGSDTYFQTKVYFSGPPRRAGESLILKDAANPLQSPRKAWQYLPGQRRVKLAPNLAYDTPNGGGVSGTYDDLYIFNGALDRYDWKLVGKEEMFVPYNTYDLTYIKDTKSLITPDHLNPEFVRWEKHRVWVVEATLKAGKRHVYAKRRFYLDEDSWSALASDEYDARGQLYRGSLAFFTQSYDVGAPDTTPQVIYDLISGGYNSSGLVGGYGGLKYVEPLSKAQWAPDALAGAGIR